MMARTNGTRVALLAAALALGAAAGSVVTAEERQDKYRLEEPNGIAFSEVRGYESWQAVAPSYRTDKSEVRVILGNEILVKAFAAGVPLDGRPFPDGAILVKIGYSQRKNPSFPDALEPDVLQRVELMIKDAKRFERTRGWGFARFVYDAKAKTFAPYGKEAGFDQECAACHTAVAARDFVFTRYAPR